MSPDDALLLDMLQAARRIQRYASGLDFDGFQGDELRQDAIIRRLTIIGEAANGLSPLTRSALPSLPWSAMIGMRNILVHNYARVNLTIV